MLDSLAKKLSGIMLTHPEVVNKHDKEEMIKANARLNELEQMSGNEMSQAYREGFVQGWIEKSWKDKE